MLLLPTFMLLFSALGRQHHGPLLLAVRCAGSCRCPLLESGSSLLPKDGSLCSPRSAVQEETSYSRLNIGDR